MPKMMKRLMALLMCLLLTVGISAPAAFADGAEEHAAKQPDYSRTGSVTVEVRTAEGAYVGGGSLKMYQVALAQEDDGNQRLVYTSDFADCGQDLAELESNMPAIAAAMADYDAEKGLTATELNVGKDGKVVFPNLALGLYLFVQDNPMKGYSALRPFLVTVPLWNGEELVYDVLANPKPGTATGLVCLPIEVEKIAKANSGTLPKNVVFTFRLTPESLEQPMPDAENAVRDEKTRALSMSRTDAGTLSFGEIWFDLEDIGKTYTYKLEELRGSTAGFIYDSKVYTIQVTVLQQEEGADLSLRVVCTDSNGKAADISALQFTNVYDPREHLPQTGQIWWPVSLLAAAGLILFLIGWKLRRKQA